MSTTREKSGRPLRREPKAGSVKLMFDYRAAARAAGIASATLRNFEEEARDEFPGDPMLMELHVLRAVKAESARREMRRRGEK